MENHQISTNSNLNLFLQHKSDNILQNMENHIVIQMFNQLHDSYNLLPINDSPTINIDISPIDKSKYESNYLKPIKTICNLIFYHVQRLN